ncbi:MAG: DNA-binding LytR/AlgR family response regulator [Planctomycetota bacterium]
MVFLDVDEVERVESAANFLRIQTRDNEYLARETLSSLAARLSAGSFVQIYRSHLVRLKAIRRIGLDSEGKLSVFLRTGAGLRISLAYREDLRHLMIE